MATSTGRRAETLAAEYLQRQGFAMVAQNWRTRWCEIDLVTEREGTIHIIEVKYRANPEYGPAAAYVTATKLQQLKRAASFYQHETNDYRPIQVDVVAIEGDLAKPSIELIENVTL